MEWYQIPAGRGRNGKHGKNGRYDILPILPMPPIVLLWREKAMFSRRGFFERLTHLAEDPEKVRARRVAELRAWAMECASLDWDATQREETGQDVERKLSYLSDATLRQEN